MKLFALAIISCLSLLAPQLVVAQSSPEAPAQDLAEISLSEIDHLLTELTVSPDGKYVAASFGIGRGLLQDPEPGLVMVWESETGKNVFSSRDFIDGVSAVAFTWEGKHLVATGYAGELMVWNAKSFDLIHKHQEQNSGLHCLAVSSGTDRICYGSLNSDEHCYLTVFDIETFREIARIDAGLDVVWDVSISSDGKMIGAAVSSLESYVSIWDVNSRTITRAIEGPMSQPRLQFVPKSDQVLISFIGYTDDDPSEIWLYDPKSDKTIWKQKGPEFATREAIFSLDNQFLGVLSANKKLSIFALKSGKLLSTTLNVKACEMAISAKADVVAEGRNEKILIQWRSIFPTDQSEVKSR